MIELGNDYKVRVVKYLKKGIIVRFIDEPSETGFIHLSQISPDFVSDVSMFVRLGDELVAKAVDDPKFDTQLSLLHLRLHAQYEPAYTNGAAAVKPADRKVAEQEIPIVHIDLANTHDRTAVTRTKINPEKSHDSLDKMIKDANDSFADKMQGQRKKARRRR